MVAKTLIFFKDMKELFSNLTVRLHSNCSYIIAHSNFVFFLALSFAQEGGRGAKPGVPGHWYLQFSEDQVTLFQSGRADFAPTLILAPSVFHTFLRPWTLTTRAGRATLHVVHNDAKKDDLFDKTKLHFFVVFVA